MTALALALLLGGAPAKAAPAPHVENENWVIDARVEPAPKQGQPSTLLVQLDTRNGFHLNEDYPINFKADAETGFEKAKASKGDGVELAPGDAKGEEKHRALVRLRFNPRAPGQALVGGVFAFSSCSAERCLIDKIEVRVQVDVTK